MGWLLYVVFYGIFMALWYIIAVVFLVILFERSFSSGRWVFDGVFVCRLVVCSSFLLDMLFRTKN